MLPIIILFSLFFGAEVYGELAPLFRTGDNAIPGEYLVLLKPDTTQSLEQRLIGIDQHMRIMRRNKEIDISSKFEFLSFAAFSVVATEEAIEELRSVLIVELIQENTLITINGVKWESEVDLGECAAQDTSKGNNVILFYCSHSNNMQMQMQIYNLQHVLLSVYYSSLLCETTVTYSHKYICICLLHSSWCVVLFYLAVC